MHNPSEQFAKSILCDALNLACASGTEVEVLAATQEIDVYSVPDPARAAERAQLGLLGELSAEPSLFEPFHDTPSLRKVRRYIDKQHTWHYELERRARHAAGSPPADTDLAESTQEAVSFPALVVIGPGRPETVLDAYGCEPVRPGVYHGVRGLVFCGSSVSGSFGIPPVNVGMAGQTSLWVDTSGSARISDASVLRPSESRTECQIKANGFVCAGGNSFGPTNGSIVMAVSGGDPINPTVCYLDTGGTVTCTNGPRFQAGKVVYLAGDFYTDSLCAIYNDGSVWCIGSNTNGKLGTGNNLNLMTETMVAPSGSAHVACDP